eukprot:s6427_g2.t1
MSTAETGAVSEGLCQCEAGRFAADGGCSQCQRDHYCPGISAGGAMFPCPEPRWQSWRCSDNTLTATADVGGSSEADCICSAGYFREQVAGCIPCRRGYYKPNDGDQDGANVQFWFQREVADCRNSCPTNGDSKEGAVDVGDCFCIDGYHAIMGLRNGTQDLEGGRGAWTALVHIDSLLRRSGSSRRAKLWQRSARFSSWEVNLSALEDTVHGQLFGMRKYPDACSECRSSFSWMGLVVFTDIAQNILINFAVASLAAMAAATLAAMTSIFHLRFDTLDVRFPTSKRELKFKVSTYVDYWVLGWGSWMWGRFAAKWH